MVFPTRYAVLLPEIVGLLVWAAAPASSAELSLAHPSTPYGDALFSVLATIIEDRFGVQTRAVNSSNPVIFKALDANRGDIDIGAVQLPNGQSQVDEYVTGKKTVILSPNYWQFNQGICTVKPVADQYNIRSVYDLTRPEVVTLTAKGAYGKGEIWIGAAEWNTAAIDRVRARFYGLSELYELTTSQPELELARVRAAAKTGTPILWVCDGASNFVLPKDAISQLGEPVHDPAKWHPVLPSQDPDWYQKSRVETSWPPVHYHFVYAKHLQTDLPDVARLIDEAKITADMVGTWTYATSVEKRDRAEYAKEWVKANSALIDSWTRR